MASPQSSTESAATEWNKENIDPNPENGTEPAKRKRVYTADKWSKERRSAYNKMYYKAHHEAVKARSMNRRHKDGIHAGAFNPKCDECRWEAIMNYEWDISIPDFDMATSSESLGSTS